MAVTAGSLRSSFARARSAAWLGWQVEANWADPVLFVIYVLARPLATALILAAMYGAVRAHGAGTAPGVSAPAVFAGFFVANAFHNYVNKVLVGLGWAVFEEREEYETLKYVYASPVGMFTYLTGRSVVKFALATISMLATLLVGWFLLGVRWDWAHVQWLPLVAATAAGLASTLFLGLLLAGWSLVLARAAMVALEGTALASYLLCGVIFPIDLLPLPARWVALGLPFTWWYEALRRFLAGHGTLGLMQRFTDNDVLLWLGVTTVAFALLARWGYFAFERQARRLGRLDQTTLF
jgi:ABC-2 type transport system permease protein